MLMIENEFLSATAENMGGELTSVVSKKTGKQYLFNGDKKYWGFHAPMLFPIACGLVNDKYRHDGKEYTMLIHGFAHRMMLETVEHTAGKMVFRLTENEETLKMYPFRFKFTLSYTVEGASVNTAWEVENTNDGPLYFSTGGHPGLTCPVNDGESFEDYYLEFERPENASRMLCVKRGSILLTHQEIPFLQNESKIDLNYDMFSQDAIILKGLKSGSVALKSRKSDNYASLSFEGFPFLGLWTRANMPYVCIEPWYGHPDYEDFTGELKDKAGIIQLEKGEKFNCSYRISVFE